MLIHLNNIKNEENEMHTDENKKYDRRNIDSNLQRGSVSTKEYETYLSRLPDVSDKAFDPDEEGFEDREGLGESNDRGVLSKRAAPGGGKG